MKHDLIGTCNEQQQVKNDEFVMVWCKRCRNTECERAGWGTSSWEERISTQADRFLNNPLFADPNDPNFEEIKQQHFADMLHRAVQIEIADRRGNWEIPDLLADEEVRGVNDQNRHNVSNPKTTEDVDFAAHRLAAARGKELPPAPQPEDPPVLTEPVHFRAESSPPTPEPPPQERPPERPPQPPVAINTPMPVGGIMIGGEAPPSINVESMQLAEPTDPWAIPKNPERVVEVGATVVLAATDEENE